MDFALNYPERIATLTLIEPAAYWVARGYGQFEREMREFAQLIQSFHDPPSEEDLTRFLKINGLVPPGVEPKNMARWPVWNQLKTALLSLHTVIEHSDDLARLQLLQDLPVLLVKGKDSTKDNQGIVDLLSKSLSQNSRVLVLPDGHASHIVAQDQFIKELEKFIVENS